MGFGFTGLPDPLAEHSTDRARRKATRWAARRDAGEAARSAAPPAPRPTYRAEAPRATPGRAYRNVYEGGAAPSMGGAATSRSSDSGAQLRLQNSRGSRWGKWNMETGYGRMGPTDPLHWDPEGAVPGRHFSPGAAAGPAAGSRGSGTPWYAGLPGISSLPGSAGTGPFYSGVDGGRPKASFADVFAGLGRPSLEEESGEDRDAGLGFWARRRGI